MVDNVVNKSKQQINNRKSWTLIKLGLGLCVFLLGLLSLSSCQQTEKDKVRYLDVTLDDSLQVSQGKYDSIRLDIIVVNGNDTIPLKTKAFYGEYTKQSILLDLGANPNENIIVVVMAFKNGQELVRKFVHIDHGIVTKKESFIIIVKPPIIPPDTTHPIPPTNKPTQIKFTNISPLTLTVGGAATTVAATIMPSDADQAIIWKSMDSTIATVSVQGLVQAVKAGPTFIKATAHGDSNVTALLTVQVNPAIIIPPAKPTSVQMITTPEINLADNGILSKADAKVLPTNALQTLIWSIADINIATVDSLGNVKGLKAGNTTLKATSKEDPTLFATLPVKVLHVIKAPDSVRVTPKTKTFYTGSKLTDSLKVTFYPADTARVAEFKSNDVGIVTVSSKGLMTPIAQGKTTILVNQVGDKNKFDSCVVTVIKDMPKLDAGADKNVQANQPITFNITVTQAFGTIDILRWDLNGDNVWDDSTKNATANPVYTYPLASSYTAKFYVRDSEGNDTLVTRQVITDAQIPQIKITHPAQDTLVNNASFIVEYDSNGVKKTKPYTLAEGRTKIVIKANNAGKIGGDSLYITLDSQSPATASLSAATPTQNPAWTWPAVETKAKYSIRLLQGSTPRDQQTLNSAGYTPPGTITLTDGVWTLYVKTIDSAGNTSNEVSSPVTVDRTKPLLAILTPDAEGRVTAVDPTITGTVSDNSTITKLTYSLSPSGRSGNITIPTSGATWILPTLVCDSGVKNTITIHAEDAAGLSSIDQSIDIYKWPNVVFVRAGKTGNGTSWKEAYGFFDSVATSTRAQVAGAQVWISKGVYGLSFGNKTLYMAGDGLVLGGFAALGAPLDTTMRNSITNAVTLKNYFITFLDIKNRFDFKGIDFQNFSSEIYSQNDGVFAVSNCNFYKVSGGTGGGGRLINLEGGGNVEITNSYFYGNAGNIRSRGNVTIKGTSFSYGDQGSIPVLYFVGTQLIIDGSTLGYSKDSTVPEIIIDSQVKPTIIKNSYIRGGRAAILDNGYPIDCTFPSNIELIP